MSLFTRMPSRASGTRHNQILDEVLADQEGRLLRRRPLGVGVRAAWPRECPEGSAPEGDRATAEDPVADASSSRSHRPPSSVQYGSGVAGDRSYRLYPTSRRAPSCRPRGASRSVASSATEGGNVVACCGDGARDEHGRPRRPVKRHPPAGHSWMSTMYSTSARNGQPRAAGTHKCEPLANSDGLRTFRN